MDARSEPPVPRSRRWPWVAAAAALAVATFAPTMRFGFVNWDDPDLIVENPRVAAWRPQRLFAEPGTAYLPVRDLAWNLTRRVAGMEPWAFHLLNVALHALATALFCVLAAALLGPGGGVAAGVAAAVFAVHPLHVEPVAWASGTKDPLSAALMFAAFGLYLRVERSAGRGGLGRLGWLGGSLVLFWAAALAKSSALVLPLLLALYGATLARRRRRALALVAPFAVVAAVLAVVALEVGRGSGVVKVRTRPPAAVARTMVGAAGTYLRQLVLPAGLSPCYPAGHAMGPALACVAAYAALVVAAARRHGRLLFALGWLGVALLPYLGIVPTSTHQADRYAYLAVGGYAMVLGLAAGEVWGARGSAAGAWKRWVAGAAVAGVVAVCVGLSIRQSGYWRSSERLWARAVAVAPDDALAHYLMGDAIWTREPERAAGHFRQAADARLEAAARHWLAAGAAREAADEPLATRHEAVAAEQERLAADALAYLGTALREAGDAAGALKAHREAMLRRRGEPRFHYLVADDLAAMGRVAQALPHYRQAAGGPRWLAAQVAADLAALRDDLSRRGRADEARAVGQALRRVRQPR